MSFHFRMITGKRCLCLLAVSCSVGLLFGLNPNPTPDEPVLTLIGHSSYVNCLAFAPDGKRLYSGSSDHTIRIWEVNTGKEISKLGYHKAVVSSLACSPDGTNLVSADVDGVVVVYSLSTEKVCNTIENVGSNVAFSPDGKLVAIANCDQSVVLAEAFSGKILATIDGLAGKLSPQVAFSTDGSILATGTDHFDKQFGAAGALKFWKVATGKQVAAIGEHGMGITSIMFSNDTKTVATSSRDGTIRIWSVEGKKALCTLKGHKQAVRSIAFSKDGKLLASGAGVNVFNGEPGEAMLWDVKKGEKMASFSGHADTVSTVVFSPDGKMLATASYDKTIKLWDVNKLINEK